MRLTRSAIRYSIERLIGILNFSQSVLLQDDTFRLENGITFSYTSEIHSAKDNAKIIVIPCQESAWLSLVELPKNSLYSMPVDHALPSNTKKLVVDKIPVLFWGKGYEDGSKPFAERYDDSTIIFYADIIAATFFMLSRWEETISSVRDQHGRFPATSSVAYKQGFLDLPIIDEYALVLGAWLKTILPSWEMQPHRFSVKLSHDIDTVRTATLRRIGGDLFKRKNIRRAAQTLHALVSPNYDPALQSCYELASLSEQYGLTSAFYFMAAERSSFDSGYDPCSKLIQSLIIDLRQRGHEVGFHPGYQTFSIPERFYQEKQRMDAALGETRYGGRQHYLRFRAPETWRLWETAGLAYDSTVCYADHEGFRCGTCHPFQPFDVEADRVLDIWEIPLIVMDGTLKQYRQLTPEQGAQRILTLAQRCQAVNGIFTLLWHNTSLLEEWTPWAVMYQHILPHLAALENR